MAPRTHPGLLFAAVFFAAMASFQSAGWFLAWKGLQIKARFEAEKSLFAENALLESKTFDKDYFHQIKIGRKEIVFEAKLYDYRVLSETEDSLRVALYHDAHEQKLLSALGRVFGAKLDSAPPTPVMTWLALWLGATFLLPAKNALPQWVDGLYSPVFPLHQLLRQQAVQELATPPPEM